MTQSTLSSFSSHYGKSVIGFTVLAIGDVFAVHTNGGNYAAVLVTGIANTSITIQYTTFGLNPGPVITVVENNYGDIPAGFPNSGIAQGALFFVVGAGLATPGTVAVLQNAVGNILPTTINGASITVTVGSTTVTPAMYYAQPTAVAGVLPSNTPLGAGTVTVTYNNQTSSAWNITVVASAMGFLAYNEGGTGAGVAVNVSNGTPFYNYTNLIPPGTTVILYGSGLGADPKPARDTTYVAVTSAVADSINALTHIYVGGVDGGPPGYQGASGYPGLNQINFTIPANAPTGCSISLVGVNALGVPTNIVSLPVGTGTCSDPFFGTNGTQLQTPSGQTTVTSGALDISQTTASEVGGKGPTTLAEAVGDFAKLSGPFLRHFRRTFDRRLRRDADRHYSGRFWHFHRTGCRHNHTHQPVRQRSQWLPLNSLGRATILAELTSGYIPPRVEPFTFQGMGGANVGPFTATVTFPNSVLTWTNQSAAATRDPLLGPAHYLDRR